VDATHTVGITADRDLTGFGLKLYLKNALINFVPSGAPVTQVREVVSTAACNQCHNPLGAHHSGDRQEVGLCILCHQPQTTDADTLNTLDFKVFIHKLHDGANLPSVKAGKPYQIIRVSGGVNYVNDYSKVVWPQDVRNCTTCHQGASQADNWKTNPNRAACGSCHDNVNFATGTNHAGGVQLDDSKCRICHPADGPEFDLSVSGAHTIPNSSTQLNGMNVEITGITDTAPGSKPTVTFTATTKAGVPINITKGTDSFVLRLAGPGIDYTWNVSEDARSGAKATPSGYSYTFTQASSAIPKNAKGTYSVSAEFYKDAVPLAGPLLGQNIVGMDTGMNPIRFFSVDGSTPEPRRIVDINSKCNSCHKNLALHHGNRNDTSYCVTCHNPATTDNPNAARAAGFEVPAGTVPESINFRFMIHRIHRGKQLQRDFTVYRSRGVFNFNEIGFPGDLRDCATCHVNNSYQLPLPANMSATLAPREFFSPLGPAASACLGCHDGEDAAAHAYLMTAPFGESCPVCHAEGADFAVSKVHAH
jgi:OmcA/MtrC family decaheme c-type cytochrome